MSNTEIITPSEARQVDLQAHADEINKTLDLIVMHEDAFEESTLEPRLIIGLEIAKAQEVFGMTKAEAGAIGGSKPQCGMLANPLGFSAWLAGNIKRLPRSTAQKYATAFRALGLATSHATPSTIRAKIKDIRHHCGKNNLPMPTLTGLYKSGKPAKAELLGNGGDPEPQEDPTRLGDARVAWTLWREKAENYVATGVLDDLDKPGLEDLKEFNLWLRDKLNARLKNA